MRFQESFYHFPGFLCSLWELARLDGRALQLTNTLELFFHLTKITISPPSQNLPGAADSNRKSLQLSGGNISQLPQITLPWWGQPRPKVAASCGGSLLVWVVWWFLYGEIKLGKRWGGCGENGCEGRSLELPHRPASSSHPKRKYPKANWESLWSATLAISQQLCWCKISQIIQCIMIAALLWGEPSWWSKTFGGGRLPQQTVGLVAPHWWVWEHSLWGQAVDTPRWWSGHYPYPTLYFIVYKLCC